jgi:hypothetical protein
MRRFGWHGNVIISSANQIKLNGMVHRVDPVMPEPLGSLPKKSAPFDHNREMRSGFLLSFADQPIL